MGAGAKPQIGRPAVFCLPQPMLSSRGHAPRCHRLQHRFIGFAPLAGPPPRSGGTRCATGRARGCTVAALAHLAGLARLPRTPHCLARCPHPRAPRTLRGAHCWRRGWRALAPASQAQPPAAPAGAPPPPGAAGRRACSARFARFTSVAGGRPAGAFFALMAYGHQRGARLPLLACSPRQGRFAPPTAVAFGQPCLGCARSPVAS